MSKWAKKWIWMMDYSDEMGIDDIERGEIHEEWVLTTHNCSRTVPFWHLILTPETKYHWVSPIWEWLCARHRCETVLWLTFTNIHSTTLSNFTVTSQCHIDWRLMRHWSIRHIKQRSCQWETIYFSNISTFISTDLYQWINAKHEFIEKSCWHLMMITVATILSIF